MPGTALFEKLLNELKEAGSSGAPIVTVGRNEFNNITYETNFPEGESEFYLNIESMELFSIFDLNSCKEIKVKNAEPPAYKLLPSKMMPIVGWNRLRKVLSEAKILPDHLMFNLYSSYNNCANAVYPRFEKSKSGFRIALICKLCKTLVSIYGDFHSIELVIEGEEIKKKIHQTYTKLLIELSDKICIHPPEIVKNNYLIGHHKDVPSKLLKEGMPPKAVLNQMETDAQEIQKIPSHRSLHNLSSKLNLDDKTPHSVEDSVLSLEAMRRSGRTGILH